MQAPPGTNANATEQALDQIYAVGKRILSQSARAALKRQQHQELSADLKHPDPNERPIDRRFVKLVKLVLSKGAHAAIQLAQVGTDTTLDVVSLDLPTEEVADVLFSGLNGLMFVEQTTVAVEQALSKFAQLKGASAALLHSYERGGPDQVEREMQALLTELGGPESRAVVEFKGEMRRLYDKVLAWAAPFFASLIELIVPELGAARAGVEDFLLVAERAVRDHPFQLLKRLYNTLPESGRHLLENHQALAELVAGICMYLINLFPTQDMSRTKRMVKTLERTAGSLAVTAPLLLLPAVGPEVAVTVLVANAGLASSAQATQLVHDQLEKYVVPHVDKMVSAAQQCMSLMFALVYLLEK